MLMGLSICATLDGTISYGDPPTTISSCRDQPIIAIRYKYVGDSTTPSEARFPIVCRRFIHSIMSWRCSTIIL